MPGESVEVWFLCEH